MDLSGQRFGKLTVVSRAELTGGKSGGAWLCRCDCGRERIVKTSRLLSGKLKSCGQCSRIQDLTGKRYGRLVVLKPAEPLLSSGRKRARCLCQCDCGNTVVVLASNLKAGTTTSCGRQSRKTTKYCIICGKPFTEISSRAKNKVTCSPECQAKRIGAMKHGCIPSKEARKKMSEAHKNENVYKHLDEVRGDSTKALLKDPRYGRFETNVHAIRWHLVSPDGETFRFRNLNQWLRTVGSRYFDLDDSGPKFNKVRDRLQHVKWKTKKTGRQQHYRGWAVVPVEKTDINSSDSGRVVIDQRGIHMADRIYNNQ